MYEQLFYPAKCAPTAFPNGQEGVVLAEGVVGWIYLVTLVGRNHADPYDDEQHRWNRLDKHHHNTREDEDSAEDSEREGEKHSGPDVDNIVRSAHCRD